ncbi:uncharacterized protein SPPG_03979 [Spizellomyces punctatus DAOM BR117]|uniref:EGF-like domain-containing protein n=1 Tax=Spizellomyces punctatus (strain DAOM BR117) TaxID=645134 RepID=A0A0L0HIC0_SPIPD|nr:uncharacterized protein SPPG_03979 [Spizellomyces punctatus DAOM BR117]KND00877.1 hypothetical protein SPPG_03979 [Spizellomyces punctatus DAOM BR117]|eukprot:XP_016608916.1 hypothetical protein SPPG_03979 [Spizellomyces punctatus DAOM BR117]
MGHRWIIFIFVLLLLAHTTRPDEEDFKRNVREYAAEQSIWHLLASTAVLGVTDAFHILRLDDYGLFTVISVPNFLGKAPLKFVGLFGTFIPLSWKVIRKAWQGWELEGPHCQPCLNGICIGNNKCFCLPSFSGPTCEHTMPKYVTLWDYVGYFVPVARQYTDHCIFGIPIHYLPSRVVSVGEVLGVIDVSTQLGLLDLLVLLYLGIYVAWKVAPRDIMQRHFVAKYANLREGARRYHVLLTSAWSHDSFLQLGVNLYGLYEYGPMIYQVLGPITFLYFYLLTCVGTASLSLFFGMIRGRYDKEYHGATGSIMALRCFTVWGLSALGKGVVKWQAVKDMALWQVAADIIANGGNVDGWDYIAPALVSGIFYYHWWQEAKYKPMRWF